MIILYAIPAFMLLIVIEAIADSILKTHYYRFNDAVSSLCTGMLNRTMDFVTLYVSWAAYTKLFSYFSWFTLEQSIGIWVLAFIIYDFFYYWSHRLAHVYSMFWNSHAVHHQSEEFNLTTALRQPFSGFVKGSIVFLPMVFMGFDPVLVATVGSLNLVYQFWVHTRFVPRLGFVEWVFVTPSNHRVHHGMNNRYIDKNFGGVFIVWDRMFKTYQDELNEDPVIFGVRKQLNSFNPFYANFQIYWHMLKDILIGRSIKLAFQVLISRTGQRPGAIELKAPIERLDLATFEPYDPTQIKNTNVLIWGQLLFSLGYTVWFLLTVNLSNFVDACVHFLPLGLTLLSMTHLLEGKAIGWQFEVSKLIAVTSILVLYPHQWLSAAMLSYAIVASILLIVSFLMHRKSMKVGI